MPQWSASPAPPTTCPHNAAHEVRGAQEILATDLVTWVSHLTTIPFLAHANTIVAAKSTGGNVSITLPAASLYPDAIIMVVKTAAQNTVTITGHTTLTALNETFITKSDGADWRTDNIDHAGAMAFVTSLSERMQAAAAISHLKVWEFLYTLPNARNNTAAYEGPWHALNLNTTRQDAGLEVIRTTGTPTTLILQPGEYSIHASQTFYRTVRTQLRVYNTTDELTVASSMSLYNPAIAVVHKTFHIDSPDTALELQYRIIAPRGRDAGSSSDDDENDNRGIQHGLGKAAGFGEPELYTVVQIQRIGT